MCVTFLTTDFDVNQLIQKIAQFNLSKSLNDWFYTDQLKRLKKGTPELIVWIVLPLRSSLVIYENLLYCNANDCLMISTHCQKISGSLQEEMMLHGKYSDLIATLFFHFVFLSERQNYLMDCNIKFFFSLILKYCPLSCSRILKAGICLNMQNIYRYKLRNTVKHLSRSILPK